MARTNSPDVSDEHSPLISPKNSGSDDVERGRLSFGSLEYGEDDEDLKSKSAFYLFLLTLSIGGLQIVWSVELSHGSPYLLSLGMSKSFLAFVWIAGPLSGVLVQPYVGIRSDNCRISWGKRKPFMVGGGCATIFALLVLGWTREIAEGVAGLVGPSSTSPATKTASVVLATIMMYVLDFSINTVQAGIRCFIVDNAPAHQQEAANAWASRITGVGNVLGYVAGYIDLPRHLRFLGDSQFKVLSVIASVALGTTLLLSCLHIKERNPRLDGPPSSANPGILSFFGQVFKSIEHLPPQIRQVCFVQFFAWMGWFPFLFYVTTYIGQLYLNPIFLEQPNLPADKIEELWEKATRIGTLALLVYAIVSFLSNVILPFFIIPSYKALERELQSDSDSSKTDSKDNEAPLTAPTILSAPHVSSLSGHLPYSTSKSDLPTALSPTPGSRLQIPRLTLPTLWRISHLLFALCMFTTFIIRTPLSATVMTGFVGVSWSVTLWAPFALISAEVARREELRRRKRRQGERQRKSEGKGAAGEGETAMTNDNPSNSSAAATPEEEPPYPSTGLILGLHNVAVSTPQVLATLVSSLIFKALQTPRGEAGDPSLAWVLRVGGIAALAAAWVGRGLGEG
ncbi:MAG: hypothetical protein Q9160_001259 [Pyrenula sp. 1 TL-2023]